LGRTTKRFGRTRVERFRTGLDDDAVSFFCSRGGNTSVAHIVRDLFSIAPPWMTPSASTRGLYANAVTALQSRLKLGRHFFFAIVDAQDIASLLAGQTTVEPVGRSLVSIGANEKRRLVRTD
jgi:hypothetical protein